jgi:uncharacterized protein YaeQ
MALKSTIYKAELQIADMDRHYYGDHALTIARHPSETDDRMMERLEFTKGLSDTDEPDLWQKDLTGQIETWIEVGQPEERRIAKASGRADRVIVIAYGGRTSEIWWQGVKAKVERMQNVTVWSLTDGVATALGALAERTMRLQCRTVRRRWAAPRSIRSLSTGRCSRESRVDGLTGPGRRSGFRWPFQFNEIAFQIEEIERRAKAFSTVSTGFFSQTYTVLKQMRTQCGGIEWFHAQAQVIHVVARARRATFRPVDLRAYRQQINQRASRAHLNQPKLALFLLYRTAQHRLVKADHGIKVRTANHDVINLADGYVHRMSPFF